jgi:hypothetical protein
MKPSMTSNMLPLQKGIEFFVIVYARKRFFVVGVPFLAPVDQVFVQGVQVDPTIGVMLLDAINFSPTHIIVGYDPGTELLSYHFPVYRVALFFVG